MDHFFNSQILMLQKIGGMTTSVPQHYLNQGHKLLPFNINYADLFKSTDGLLNLPGGINCCFWKRSEQRGTLMYSICMFACFNL